MYDRLITFCLCVGFLLQTVFSIMHASNLRSLQRYVNILENENDRYKDRIERLLIEHENHLYHIEDFMPKDIRQHLNTQHNLRLQHLEPNEELPIPSE